jgi:rRNA-processing protein FCF1
VVVDALVLVVEGAARAVAGEASPPGVRTVAAASSGDDEVVAQVAAAAGRQVIVVTADRGLRDRVLGGGVRVAGPGWLWDLLGGR